MRTLKWTHRRWQRIAWGVCLGLLFFYLLLSLTQGQYRIIAQRDLEARIQTLEDELTSLRAERAALARRVQLLRSESLDPDLLDEAALEALGFAKTGDLLILLPERLEEAGPDTP